MPFRIRTNKLFLTYAQCELSKEEVLEWFQKNFEVKGYIVARESHALEGHHLHVYIETMSRVDIKNPRRCDIKDHHPKIEAVKSATRVQQYCKKDGEFLTNLKFNVEERARELAKTGDVKGAMRLIVEELPQEIKFLKNWEDGFRRTARLYKKVGANTKKKRYTLDDFEVPKEVETWRTQQKDQRVLVMSGDSGSGKTQLAKALFENPLVVRHIDKLKQFDEFEHDGIIFDDMSFTHYPREPLISMLDLEEDSDINVKCSMVTIPAGVPRVITTNRDCWEERKGLDPLFAYGDKAIRRRVKLVACDNLIPGRACNVKGTQEEKPLGFMGYCC